MECFDSLPQATMYRTIYLFAFHAFLRISNIVPTSRNPFIISKNLARGDVITGPPGLHIILKWSKTMQNTNQIKTVPLAYIPSSSLCPVPAFNELVVTYPVHHNCPTFSYRQGGIWLQSHSVSTPASGNSNGSYWVKPTPLHIPYISSVWCHSCIQSQCSLARYSITWHLAVGRSVDLHPAFPHAYSHTTGF